MRPSEAEDILSREAHMQLVVELSAIECEARRSGQTDRQRRARRIRKELADLKAKQFEIARDIEDLRHG